MFERINEIALGVLNTVIWTLYQKGEYRGAKLIEKQRDREALDMIDKKHKAYQDRVKIYEKVQVIIARGTLERKTPIEMKNQVLEIKQELAKVFYCLASNVQRLRKYEKMKELYNAAAYSYLHTYEGWREPVEVNRSDLYDFRSKLSTVERCIRHIKADHPELFNAKLIKKAALDEAQIVDSFGNDVIGL